MCFQPLSGKRNTVRMRSFPSFSAGPAGDLALAERVRSLAQADSWDELSQFLQTLTLPAQRHTARIRGDRLKERLELLRGEAMGALQELGELFSSDGEACEEELRCTYPLLCDLKRLTLDFSQRYEEKKQEKGASLTTVIWSTWQSVCSCRRTESGRLQRGGFPALR